MHKNNIVSSIIEGWESRKFFTSYWIGSFNDLWLPVAVLFSSSQYFLLVKCTKSAPSSKYSTGSGKEEPQKCTPDFHDKYGNAVLVRVVAFLWCCKGIYSNTNWSRMEAVPSWQSHPKGMVRLVVISTGIIFSCFNINS